MTTIAVVNLKGGSGKTTTTAFLLHAFQEAGLDVFGVDADGENESLVGWQAAGDWPIRVAALAKPSLHLRIADITPPGIDVTVIDTPPLKERHDIVEGAVMAATHVLITMAPTPIEYDRLPAVRELVDKVRARRPDDPLALAVLLNRCAPRAASTGVYRSLITDDGITVLDAQINRREVFAQAYGDPIRNALATPYGEAATELLDLKATAA
jgi:chromosome partitioning protein